MLKNLWDKIKDVLFINKDNLDNFLYELRDIEIQIDEGEHFKKEYEGYTNEDFELEINQLTNAYVAEIERELLGDATYYDVDSDGVSINDSLLQSKINSEREKAKELAKTIISENKLSIKKLPELNRKKEDLLQLCKIRTGMSRRKFERKLKKGKLTF